MKRNDSYRSRTIILLCTGLSLGVGVSVCLRAADNAPPSPDNVGEIKDGVRASPPPCPSGNGLPAPLPIDLPTALQLSNASNPTVALARERVREAYYRIREAQAAFLPNVYAGPQYNRHDGIIQNSIGNVFTTDKWNFFVGGTMALEWDTPNLLFGPLIARQLADAAAAAARSVDYNIQLQVAYAYLDLLSVYAQLAINADTLSRAEEMLDRAEQGDRAGLAKPPDVSRARSEVALRREERIVLTGQVAVVSARLTQLLVMDPTLDLQPADHVVLPIVLVPPDLPLPELISAGLANRPEMAESRALVGAAQGRLRQAQYAPLIPHLYAGYSSGDFGGAHSGVPELFGGRGDGSVMLTWQLSGLGLGNIAQTNVQRTVVNEATIHVREIETQVGAEVAAAAKMAVARQKSLADAQQAVAQAIELWTRLEKAAFGMASSKPLYDPLEPLTAEQQLDTARRAYLNEVIEFNRAQFRLYWAMGQPPAGSLPKSAALPVEVPVVPLPRDVAAHPLPLPRKIEPADKK
jgi:outer membrane protein TolC